MNLWPSPSSIDASPHQQEAWGHASTGCLSILTGGPGTGKTTVAAEILRAIAREYGSQSLRVAAPTGKAAVRITAAMQGRGLDVEATTIHRMLGVQRNGHDGDGWGFFYNRARPLPARFVAIDEPSMLCTDLGASLFAALQPGTHVLLTGDPGQLPPVGHGAPLRDMLAAGVCHGELTEIWRNAGDVVHACRAIREGKPWSPSDSIDIPAGRNLKHIETRHSSHTLRHLERLLSNMPAGISPVWDVQVLCAVNEKSDLSRKALNKLLQGVLNGHSREVKQNPFRKNDKVICLSNTMLPLADDPPGAEPGEFVANGEIGRVVHAEPKLSVVRFDSPARSVRVVGGYHDDWDLAYAVTVHKSQGSQWPVVIYVSDDYPGARYVASRQLIYTALSRMEKLAVTIGRKATMDLDCQRDSLTARKTFLVEQIRGAA